jgi:hypothetical protein
MAESSRSELKGSLVLGSFDEAHLHPDGEWERGASLGASLMCSSLLSSARPPSSPNSFRVSNLANAFSRVGRRSVVALGPGRGGAGSWVASVSPAWPRQPLLTCLHFPPHPISIFRLPCKSSILRLERGLRSRAGLTLLLGQSPTRIPSFQKIP